MDNQYTLLLVDDEPQIRDILAIRFRRTGQNFNILEASSGKEAFEIWKNNKVDIVLSDIRMPNGTGIELLENIMKESKDAMVILITGFSDALKDEVLNKGAVEMFTKPIDINQIVSKVSSLLNI